jgi:AraC-like DNA-binding protein
VISLQLIVHNSGSQKTEFLTADGSRPWGILFIISAGKYTLTFPQTGQTYTILPNEATYIPANMPFIRRIEEAIDYHQFVFQIEQDHPFFKSLLPGKLTIPPSHISTILQSLSLSTMLPQHTELIRYELEHIIKENYLFSWQTSANKLSEDIHWVITYMEGHLTEKIDMDGLAAQAFLSRTGLIWKFHQQLGTTPQQYLIMLRLRLAKHLLLEGNMTVGQIAERCGYANAYYFSNAFRTCTGISPSAFRRQTYSQKNT